MNSENIVDAVSQLPELIALASENFEPQGIYNSEMAAILAVCRKLEVEIIIESGRSRGQSTYILAKYLAASGADIHSIELVRDAHAVFAETRLAEYESCIKLHYGDSNDLFPELIGQASGRRIAILIDGPKSRKAIDLLSQAIVSSPDVVVGFIHDLQRLRKGVPYLSRTLVTRYFDKVFFTDDDDYVRAFRHLDQFVFAQPPTNPASEPPPYRPSPYHKHGEYTASYGPTLAIIFPTDADRRRARQRGKINTFSHRAAWTARRLITGDLIWAILWDLKRAARRIVAGNNQKQQHRARR
jgi:hypothetical protein